MKSMNFDQNKDESIADELFNETFNACIDKTDKDLRDNFKSLSAMTKVDG